MPSKKDIPALLSGGTTKVTVRRGRGVTLSTDLPLDTPEGNATLGIASPLAAAEPEAPEAQPESLPITRVNRGVALREDVYYACKYIAARERRKLYEVMEEALIAYLREKGEAI